MSKFLFILLAIIIINIIKRTTCNVRNVNIVYNGNKYNFNVSVSQRKVFSNVSVWTIESDFDNNLIYNYEGIVKTNGIIYEDVAMKAILFEKNNCSTNCWEGVFGFGTERNSFNEVTDHSKSSLLLQNSQGIYVSHSIPELSKTQRKKRSDNKRPSTIQNNDYKFYPKLLIVVDNVLFKKLGNSIEKTTKYISIFWSAADLQYRNITTPQIEIKITGLIIAKNEKALEYVRKNSPDGLTVNIDQVLNDSRKEKDFIKNTNFTNYDAVVTMTGLSGYNEYNGVKVGTNGISWNGSICMDDYNFSVITDNGAYFGIHNAIHELGHLLGLDHDGVFGNSYCCYPKDYHSLTVMWPKYEKREFEYWSECSLKGFNIFLNNIEESWCLRNESRQRL